MKKKEYRQLNLEGEEFPVELIREKRRSIRAFLGKTHLIIRLPIGISKADEQKHLTRLTKWLKGQMDKRPGIANRYKKADYQTDDILRVGTREYRIEIKEKIKKSHSAKLTKNTIQLSLAANVPDTQRSEAIRKLLSRVIGNDFTEEMTQRVQQLNQLYFQKNIKSVQLKYNHSNWGSCSNTGNINLSTRLLFAPPDVIDYVIIHELAHLIHLNHSAKFWSTVEKAMPNYKEKEAWLSEFGYECDF